MIISVLNQKGGVGKTTLAINMAYALSKTAPTILIDTDVQGTALKWHESNSGELLPVIGISRPTLKHDLARFSKDYKFIIIDGPAGINHMTLAAMVNSDIVLIPVQPSQPDIDSSKILASLIENEQLLHDKPRAAFVITQKRAGTRLSKEINMIMKKGNFPVFECGTFHREVYKITIPSGLTVFNGKGRDYQKACHEIMDIIEELRKFIEMPPGEPALLTKPYIYKEQRKI
jgi:chromosome partitioning protein